MPMKQNEIDRQRIQRDVDDYIAAGGKIKQYDSSDNAFSGLRYVDDGNGRFAHADKSTAERLKKQG